MILKSEGSNGGVDSQSRFKNAPNPLLLPKVSPGSRGGGYIKLRRDLGSLMPRLCGDTVNSVMTSNKNENKIVDLKSEPNLQSQYFNI